MYSGQERMARTWYALHEYETLDITSRAYQARHHRRPSADQVRQITSNFIQGREYFLSSTSAARAVRPLLQYYGVLALARGLILFLNPTAREANLVQGHGLGTHEGGGQSPLAARPSEKAEPPQTPSASQNPRILAPLLLPFFHHHAWDVPLAIPLAFGCRAKPNVGEPRQAFRPRQTDSSHGDTLDDVAGDPFLSPVVELGSLGVGVAGQVLDVLEGHVLGEQVGHDEDAEAVGAEDVGQPGIFEPSFEQAAHGVGRQGPGELVKEAAGAAGGDLAELD